MRTFNHFPKETTCKMCGKNDDGEAILVPVQGTSDGKFMEAIPVHIDCIQLIYWPEQNMFYQKGAGK